MLADKPFRTLLSREILRFARVWMQTVVPTLLTSLLYLVVFGLALGSRIREVNGVPYLEYILPGIAFMNLVTGAHMNSSWSVFDAKRERYIDEVLISPMSDVQIALAYSLGGTLRGLIIGAGVFLIGAPFIGVTVSHPMLLLLIGVLSSFIFASVGTMVGALASRIDHISLLTNVIIQPLAFLGGVFYSVEMLPGVLRTATLLNPIFHTVDAARYAALGISDLNPYPTVGIVFLLAILAFSGAWWAISRGPNLRY
ncbi:MAG: ABC transporter permease [Actinomycetota bacterium]|nr:ABC transporter permease [Actinomycetota bacterium]